VIEVINASLLAVDWARPLRWSADVRLSVFECLTEEAEQDGESIDVDEWIDDERSYHFKLAEGQEYVALIDSLGILVTVGCVMPTGEWGEWPEVPGSSSRPIYHFLDVGTRDETFALFDALVAWCATRRRDDVSMN